MNEKKPTFEKGRPDQLKLRKDIDRFNRNLSLHFELIEIVAKEDRHQFKCLVKEGFSESQALHLIKRN